MTTTPFMDTETDSPLDPAQTPDNRKCVTIIFNPVSGQTDPEQRKKLISDALAEHGYTCQYMVTSKEEGAQALAKKALEDGVDLVAVSGGDGTVMEAMSALVGTDVPIAVFPAGTGNLLSINLGIPTTVPDAVHVALNGRRYHLDLAKTSDNRHFAIMGGVGLDAQMIQDAGREAKKKFGALAYFWAVLKNLGRRRARVEIFLDDKPPLRRRVKSVLIANMGKITGGLEAMPTASPDDGLLDVGILKSATLGQGLRLLGYALLGRSQDDPDLEVHQAKRIRLRAPFPEPVQFDGEDGGRTTDLRVEILPKAVQILLPEDASAARKTREPPAVVAQRSALRRLIPAGLVVLSLTALLVWRKSQSKKDNGQEG